MTDKTWRMGFHLMPPSGWINDPNGLCQFRGVYHAFFQYSPDWPNGGERCWGHATSTNLVSWDYHDVAIHQDTPEDANGAYSGSTFVERGAAADGGDRMRIYYTGNVKHPGDYDYINEGRGANEITVTSDDGMHFSPQQVVLRNADYPAYCSCHVRDPKLWEQRGELHMALGARDRDSHGLALIYSSTDGIDWRLRTAIRPTDDFGFMWECPDVIRLVEGADGQRHEFLGFCPQGMPAKDDDGRGTSWAGYLPLSGTAIDATTADPALWREWDGGFDFYAPQTFVDDAGRTLLIAWVGMPDEDFMGQPEQLDWIHSLSVPRTLEVDPKDPTRIMQWPVGEVDALDKVVVQLACAAAVALPYVLFKNGGTIPLGGADTLTYVLLAVLVVVQTAFAYVLYFGSMGELPVLDVALLGYIEPVMSVVGSALFLHEPLGIVRALGAALVIAAAAAGELIEE